MKSEILKILEMQEEGKLTKDQAAELLAILADQAREKTSDAQTHNVASEETGAPGPRGGTARGETPRGGTGEKNFVASSAAAIHGLVDTAIGVGATIGRAAGVLGGEVVNMVHREESGNTVTLSKVDVPTGEGYVFSGNSINVSKLSNLALRQAAFTGNTLNASKVAGVTLTRGRMAQCNISGSSVSQVTVTGPEDAPPPHPPLSTALATAADAAVVTAGLRGVTLNASKFSRVQLAGASALEVMTIQAAAIKDWEVTGSTVRECKINDAAVAGLELTDAVWQGVVVERGHVQGLKVRGAVLDAVGWYGGRIEDLTIAGGAWKEVAFRRGGGGRENVMQESVFENCVLTGCEFAGCVFKRTTLRNLKLAGVTVRNVDFTGLVLGTEAEFRRAAGV